jgi:HEAT repeat protein
MSEFDFQPYLSAIAHHYRQRWQLYTLMEMRMQAALDDLLEYHLIQYLLEAIEHQDVDLRCHAAYELGQIGNVAAIPGLFKALEDPESDVRWRAAEALGRIGHVTAMPGLRKAIEDPDEYVRSRAAKALEQLDPIEEM